MTAASLTPQRRSERIRGGATNRKQKKSRDPGSFRTKQNRGPNTGEYRMEIAAKLAGIAITLVIIVAAAYLTLAGA